MRKACLEAVAELADQDDRVVFIGSDISNRNIEGFYTRHPDRFFMEGVSEQHLIGMMTGLALSGKIPYLNTIATFATRRCFEQLVIDAGLHKQPIRIIGSGGGGVYAPLGPTHIAMDDIAIMRTIPNMSIIAPSDAEEMKQLMPQTLNMPGPLYIRLAKGGDPVLYRNEEHECVLTKAIKLRHGTDVVLIGTGITSKLALEAAEDLEQQGISCSVLHYHTLKPFDVDGLIAELNTVKAVLTIEEHSCIGGLGSIVAEAISSANLDRLIKFIKLAMPDELLDNYGSQHFLMQRNGITKTNIIKQILLLLKEHG